MIYIDQKITTWERFGIDDEHKEALFQFMKENPSFTSLDLYDWAYEQGYDPHSEIIEGAEETVDPYENNRQATIEIIQDEEPLWNNSPESCFPTDFTFCGTSI
jgi:hypothetical protein